MKGLGQVAPWAPCINCRTPLPVESRSFEDYFAERPTLCPTCSKEVDWWKTIVAWVATKFAFGATLMLAGAKATLAETTLKPEEIGQVDLTVVGVPPDAEIVSLNLTSHGSAMPIVLHGNDVIREPFRPKFAVLGRGLPDGAGDGPLGIHAVWFVRHKDDTVVRHLIDAARNYEAHRFEGVVVPANIAAEAAVTPVVEMALKSAGVKKDSGSYYHQLNVLLPLIADRSGLARLPEVILTSLNRLRQLRNDVGHDGRCDPQTQADAAQHLAAAIFAVQYAEFVRASIIAKMPPATPSISS